MPYIQREPRPSVRLLSADSQKGEGTKIGAEK